MWAEDSIVIGSGRWQPLFEISRRGKRGSDFGYSPPPPEVVSLLIAPLHSMASDAPLWDHNTFKLDDHWPRSSIARQNFPFSHQPLRFLYEACFYLTFPLRILLIFVPTTIYRQTLDSNNPPNRRWLDTFSILVGRSLNDLLWIPTGGGMRGVFLTPQTDQQRLKLLKSTKALPEVIHPTLQVDDLRQPVKSWAKDAGVSQSKDLTIWWLGRRSQTLKQEKAKSGEKILMYFSG